MTSDIKAAIKATLAAVKVELATSTISPELQAVTKKAIAAAEKVVACRIFCTSGTETTALLAFHPDRELRACKPAALVVDIPATNEPRKNLRKPAPALGACDGECPLWIRRGHSALVSPRSALHQ